jgi:hypothetical protein
LISHVWLLTTTAVSTKGILELGAVPLKDL